MFKKIFLGIKRVFKECRIIILMSTVIAVIMQMLYIFVDCITGRDLKRTTLAFRIKL